MFGYLTSTVVTFVAVLALILVTAAWVPRRREPVTPRRVGWSVIVGVAALTVAGLVVVDAVRMNATATRLTVGAGGVGAVVSMECGLWADAPFTGVSERAGATDVVTSTPPRVWLSHAVCDALHTWARGGFNPDMVDGIAAATVVAHELAHVNGAVSEAFASCAVTRVTDAQFVAAFGVPVGVADDVAAAIREIAATPTDGRHPCDVP